MKENELSKAEKVLSLALDLGKSMIKCGAEINRVEETVIHIGHAYEMKDTQVFSVVSMMHATVVDNDGRTHSQMRRIYSYSTDFETLEKLNSLSRRISKEKIDIDTARAELENILAHKSHMRFYVILGYMLSAFSFAIFFGGTLLDALAALPISVVICFMQRYIKGRGASKLFLTALQGAVASALALLFYKIGLGDNFDMIIIGNIMLMIPGLLLINSVREMLCGDLMSGMLRLMESIILAISIAFGVAVPILLIGI